MTHPRRKIARTESTRITDNLDTIEAIHQRFCQALGPAALPNINREVTDGTESITLTAETDFDRRFEASALGFDPEGEVDTNF